MKWLYGFLFVLIVTASCRQRRAATLVKIHQPDSIVVGFSPGFVMPYERRAWIVYPDSTAKQRIIYFTPMHDSIVYQPVSKHVARRLYDLTRLLFVTHRVPDVVKANTDMRETDQPSLDIDVFDGVQTISYGYYLGYPKAVYSRALQCLIDFVYRGKELIGYQLVKEPAVEKLSLLSVNIVKRFVPDSGKLIHKSWTIERNKEISFFTDTTLLDKSGHVGDIRSSKEYTLLSPRADKIKGLSFSIFKKIPADVIRRNVHGEKNVGKESIQIILDFDVRNVIYTIDLSHKDVVYSADFQQLLDELP